jgi:hypothetical protein
MEKERIENLVGEMGKILQKIYEMANNPGFEPIKKLLDQRNKLATEVQQLMDS